MSSNKGKAIDRRLVKALYVGLSASEMRRVISALRELLSERVALEQAAKRSRAA